MSAIDTPDYQRGVISAQKLLAHSPGGTNYARVGVPPNAETIVAVTSSTFGPFVANAVGVTTGLVYPGQLLLAPAVDDAMTTYVFDASDVVDEQLDIIWQPGTVGPFWVYADAGVHLTVDASTLRSTQGVPYSIPSAPSTAKGDHPPNELQASSFQITTNGEVMIPPGPGLRLRVFSVQMAAALGSAAGAVLVTLYGSSGVTVGMLGFGGSTYAGGGSFAQYFPSGLALPTDSGVDSYYDTGFGTAIRTTVVYTTEEV